MTTYTAFTPSATVPFQFQPTLDGQLYTAVVTWNVYAQRYYITVLTLGGALVCSVPMCESPDGYDIDLVKEFFTSTLIYRESTGNFEVSP